MTELAVIFIRYPHAGSYHPGAAMAREETPETAETKSMAAKMRRRSIWVTIGVPLRRVPKQWPLHRFGFRSR